MIKREIITNQIYPSARNQSIATLLNMDRFIRNHSKKAAANLIPMKDLAGVKRLLQIEIRGCDFCQFHFSKVARRKNSVT